MADWLTFSQALRRIKRGGGVSRDGWCDVPGGAPHIFLVNGDSSRGVPFGGDDIEPFIMYCSAGGDWVPWVASHGDLLAEDWFVVFGNV